LRDKTLYADDLINSIEYIFEYVKGMEFEDFKNDRKTFLAVVKELEIIGEAIKHIKDDLKKIDNSYPYEQIVGFRNILVHEYFGVNYTIVWNVIFYELPKLREIVKKYLRSF
jgi:uncharacterized protein with HEPN domain